MLGCVWYLKGPSNEPSPAIAENPHCVPPSGLSLLLGLSSASIRAHALCTSIRAHALCASIRAHAFCTSIRAQALCTSIRAQPAAWAAGLPVAVAC